MITKNTLGKKLTRELEQDLQIVGEQLRLARLRRKLPMEQIAQRASCSIPTLTKVEKGDPTVSMGIYLRVLHALGLGKDILKLAADDPLGRNLQDLGLPFNRQRAAKTKKD